MFGIDSAELLLIIVVAVVVIGPKDLPRALYKFGQIVGKGRAMTRHFRAGIDAMMREAELAELEKKWADENARIMAEHTAEPSNEATAPLPAPDASDGRDASDGDVFPAEEAESLESGATTSGDNAVAQTHDVMSEDGRPGKASGEAAREASA